MKLSEFEKKKIYSEASGTMAFVDSNIKMELNQFGLFEENIVDVSKGVSHSAILVSPNLNEALNESIISQELYSNEPGIQYDERLGYYLSTFVGHVNEGNYRENASSGGMGTWIFKEMFEKKLIDYVIHVKKNKNSNSNQMFKYGISSNVEEINDGAKTRYYPVELSEVLEEVKNTQGRYAIIGIPSFIYSIRLLSKIDPIINERVKYTVGLICGHQKSSKFAEAMAFQAGIKPGDLKEIDFRHKLLDRPANEYGVKMTGIVNGELKTFVKPKADLYGQDWGWGLFKPLASNFTDDVFNETADIVLGDAWLSDYTSDSQGNNIVIIRNKDIDNLVKNANKVNKLNMKNVDVEVVFKSQASHYRHTHDELSYRLSKKDKNNTWRPKKRVSSSDELPHIRRKVQDLREILSEKSHLYYQEAVKQNNFNHFVEAMSPYTDDYSKVYRKMGRTYRIKDMIKKGPIYILKKIVAKLSN